jgi:hypothetical protein
LTIILHSSTSQKTILNIILIQITYFTLIILKVAAVNICFFFKHKIRNCIVWITFIVNNIPSMDCFIMFVDCALLLCCKHGWNEPEGGLNGKSNPVGIIRIFQPCDVKK